MLYEGFSVFRHSRYRNFWFSNTASNGAIWMQNMACAIVLTQLSTSPLINSLVQAAATLPLFLFGLLAGWLGDCFNRYKVLFWAQATLSILALVLCSLVFQGQVKAWLFIVMTFLFATATTFRMPSAQAGIASTVMRSEVKYAAIMNNLSFNLCRTLGPALAGVLLLYLPLYAVFLLSSCLLGGVAINFFFQRQCLAESGRTNNSSYGFCIRRIVQDPVFRECGLDAFFIFFSGSLVWALMPYFARYELKESAAGQGLLMGVIGLGALMTVIILPPLVKHFSRRIVLLLCYVLCLVALLILNFSHLLLPGFIIVALALFGLGWSMSVAALNGLIQSRFCSEIATRAIALYLMIMYFSQFAGSVWAGWVSDVASLQVGFYSSLFLLGAGLVLKIKKNERIARSK